MDKKQFLASGLIEQYVLGLTSEEENRLVEHFVENYPDIRAKLAALQSSVENYASQYAIPPPRRLKEKIMSEIQDEDLLKPEQILHPSVPTPAARRPSRRSFGLIWLVVLASILIGLLLWQQQRLKKNYNKLWRQYHASRTQTDDLLREQTLAETIFGYIENDYARVVHLTGSGLTRDMHAVIYWNEQGRKAHAKLVKMPALPADQQLQLWATVNGKMVSAGVLDNTRKDFQNVYYIPGADSLHITVASLGGNTQPFKSAELTIVKGKI